MGRSQPHRMALHRAGKPTQNAFIESLQRSAARRIVEGDAVHVTAPGPGRSRRTPDRTRSSDGKRRLSSHSPVIRAVIWRCAIPEPPRQLPSLPPPSRANPTARANSELDKTRGAISVCFLTKKQADLSLFGFRIRFFRCQFGPPLVSTCLIASHQRGYYCAPIRTGSHRWLPSPFRNHLPSRTDSHKEIELVGRCQER